MQLGTGRRFKYEDYKASLNSIQKVTRQFLYELGEYELVRTCVGDFLNGRFCVDA